MIKVRQQVCIQDFWLKVDINIHSHTVFTLYHDEILTTCLQQITPLHSSRAYRFQGYLPVIYTANHMN